jgi:hypothetical protein
MAELDDPLAKVCVRYFNAVALEISIQPTFLGEHRLALHHARNPALPQQLVNDAVVLFSIAGPMHDRAEPRGILLELLKVVGQVSDRMLLDSGGPLAQLFPLGQAVGALVALGANEPQRLVMPMRMSIVGDEISGGQCVIGSLHFHLAPGH